MLNTIKKIKVPQNPYLIFLPFIFFYVGFVLIFNNDTLVGDENRFLLYAHNLTNGYYSPSDITLGNGPGYPIIITPFVALDLPYLFIKLLNPVFYYFSIIFLFKSLQQIVSFRVALIFSLFWACYYNGFESMHLMYSEVFTYFLVSLLLFLLLKAFNTDTSDKKSKYIILSGFIMGYIILTKVIFGYVLLFFIIVLGILWILNRSIVNYKRGLAILVVAFITVAPYLIYTYNLTGKLFYWSTTGGENLYWMSSHYEGEYGSWFAAPNKTTNFTSVRDSIDHSKESGYLDFINADNLIPGTGDSIKSRHQKYFDEIIQNSSTGVERDAMFKKIAIRKIKADPVGYLKNCFSNVGRILFNYPYSYSTQRPSTLLRFPLNGIIVLLMLFCIMPTLLNWRKLMFPIRFIFFFFFLYLGGSVLGTAEIRMFSIVVPMILFWIAYILQKSIRVKLRFSQKD
jgi:4-amino-4-deoxy-L-arabinose transferase-like glycosyltransferase